MYELEIGRARRAAKPKLAADSTHHGDGWYSTAYGNDWLNAASPFLRELI